MTATPRPPAADRLPLGRDSVTYRLTLEPLSVLAGGPRALLLQVSHAVVGAGVADHSDYRTNPWNRLLRTLQAMTQLSLGTDEHSRAVTRMLRRSHATINGELPDGTPYRALDADNMRWVWATLLDTLVAVHETFLRPLSADELEQLYDEWLLIAEGCGVPPASCPATYEAFRAEVDRVVRHDLTATTTARDVAKMLERPPVPFPLRQLAGLVLATTVPGMLPAPLRAALGYEWSASQEAAWQRVTALSRTVARLTPGPLRRLPGAVVTAGVLRLPMAPPPRRRGAGRASPSPTPTPARSEP